MLDTEPAIGHYAPVLGRIMAGDEPDAVQSWIRGVDTLPDSLTGRDLDPGDIFEVAVDQWEDSGPWQWQITSAAMQYVRADPLRSHSEQAMVDSVNAVKGVSDVQKEDTETWVVDGRPDGRELLSAAAEGIDRFAGEIADVIDSFGLA